MLWGLFFFLRFLLGWFGWTFFSFLPQMQFPRVWPSFDTL